MGTDPTDPSSLFRHPALTTPAEPTAADIAAAPAVAVAPPRPRTESDAAFVKRHLPRRTRAARPKSAAVRQELVALTKEFGGYTLRRTNAASGPHTGPYLSVKTDPIVLTDTDDDTHELGKFEIYMRLDDSRNSRDAYTGLVRAFALQPNPSTNNDDTTHPHVQDDNICFGEGEAAVARAIRDGRLADAFVMANQVLHTYNRENPYQRLEEWYDDEDEDEDDDDGPGPCVDCNTVTGSTCDACAGRICGNCRLTCSDPRHDPGAVMAYAYCPSCAATGARFVRCVDCGDTPAGRRLCHLCRNYVPGSSPVAFRCRTCHSKAVPVVRPPEPQPEITDGVNNQPAGLGPPGEPVFGADGFDAGAPDVRTVDPPRRLPPGALADIGDDRVTRGWA